MQRRPIVTGAVALAVLVVLAAPFGDLRFGYPDAGNGADHLTSRRAFDAATDAFGPGARTARSCWPSTPAATPRCSTSSRPRSDRRPVSPRCCPPQVAADGESAAVVVIPTTGPQSTATARPDRDRPRPGGPGGRRTTGQAVHVGGLTATQVDESEYLGARLPIFIGAVIAVSFVLLLIVFRSLLVARQGGAHEPAGDRRRRTA